MGRAVDTTDTRQRVDIQRILLEGHRWDVWGLTEPEIYRRRSIEFAHILPTVYLNKLYQMEGFMNDLLFGSKFWGVVCLGVNVRGQRIWAVMEKPPNNPPSRQRLRKARMIRYAKKLQSDG